LRKVIRYVDDEHIGSEWLWVKEPPSGRAPGEHGERRWRAAARRSHDSLQCLGMLLLIWWEA